MSVTINADVIPAIEWIVNTLNEAEDCQLRSLVVEGALSDRLDICASVLISQEIGDDWYDRGTALEAEWMKQFPNINAELSIVPWPRRRS